LSSLRLRCFIHRLISPMHRSDVCIDASNFQLMNGIKHHLGELYNVKFVLMWVACPSVDNFFINFNFQQRNFITLQNLILIYLLYIGISIVRLLLWWPLFDRVYRCYWQQLGASVFNSGWIDGFTDEFNNVTAASTDEFNNSLMQVWCIGEINRWIKQRSLPEVYHSSWHDCVAFQTSSRCTTAWWWLSWPNQDTSRGSATYYTRQRTCIVRFNIPLHTLQVISGTILTGAIKLV